MKTTTSREPSVQLFTRYTKREGMVRVITHSYGYCEFALRPAEFAGTVEEYMNSLKLKKNKIT
jgi:hypothetical protein